MNRRSATGCVCTASARKRDEDGNPVNAPSKSGYFKYQDVFAAPDRQRLDPRIVVITAAMPDGTSRVWQGVPDPDVGIAEGTA